MFHTAHLFSAFNYISHAPCFRRTPRCGQVLTGSRDGIFCLFFAAVNSVVYTPSGYMCKTEAFRTELLWQRLVYGKDQTVNTVACSQITEYIRGENQATVSVGELRIHAQCLSNPEWVDLVSYVKQQKGKVFVTYTQPYVEMEDFQIWMDIWICFSHVLSCCFIWIYGS